MQTSTNPDVCRLFRPAARYAKKLYEKQPTKVNAERLAHWGAVNRVRKQWTKKGLSSMASHLTGMGRSEILEIMEDPTAPIVASDKTKARIVFEDTWRVQGPDGDYTADLWKEEFCDIVNGLVDVYKPPGAEEFTIRPQDFDKLWAKIGLDEGVEVLTGLDEVMQLVPVQNNRTNSELFTALTVSSDLRSPTQKIASDPATAASIPKRIADEDDWLRNIMLKTANRGRSERKALIDALNKATLFNKLSLGERYQVPEELLMTAFMAEHRGFYGRKDLLTLITNAESVKQAGAATEIGKESAAAEKLDERMEKALEAENKRTLIREEAKAKTRRAEEKEDRKKRGEGKAEKKDNAPIQR